LKFKNKNNELLQSNLDIMPPIGTGVKWHGNKSLLQ